MKHTLLDRAGASTLGTLLAIIIVGAVGAIVLLVIQLSQWMFTGLSADASNTIYFLEIGAGSVAVIWLIAAIINNWLNEKDAGNQGV